MDKKDKSAFRIVDKKNLEIAELLQDELEFLEKHRCSNGHQQMDIIERISKIKEQLDKSNEVKK